MAGQHVECAAQRTEHAQRQHVHFEQAHGVQVVFVPLDDAAPGHGGGLHRHQSGEWSLRQHKTAHMLAEMARKTHELLRQFQPQRECSVRGQRGIGWQTGNGFGQTLGQQVAAVHARVFFGQRTDECFVHLQRAAHVAQGAAGAVADDGGRQGGAVAAVFGVDVLNDFFAPLVLEVDIDVRRFVAFAADEALEQQGRFGGVHLGHAEAVAHGRIRGRTPALTQDVAAAGKAHQVVHRQEVHLVIQLGDQGQLMLDLGFDCFWNGWRVHAPIPPHSPRPSEPRQGLRRGFACTHGFHGVLIAKLCQAETATLGHSQRGLQQSRRVKPTQLQARAQMGLSVGQQRLSAVGHWQPQADGGQRIVQGLARAGVHQHPAHRHQWQPNSG